MLKKTLVFYLYIILPLLTFSLLLKLDLLSTNIFAFGILLYGLVYHPTIAGIRLIQLNVCNLSNFWLNFIPFWNIKYFDILFLGVKPS